MDFKTANKTAAHLYSASTALLDLCYPVDTQAISQNELRSILSAPADKLSIASVVTSGADRAAKLATDLQDNLFPALPTNRIITGAILVIYNGGDMTTEEYQTISNRLLGNFPNDIPSVVSLAFDKSVGCSIKGTLLITWTTVK
jgi:hypothetical protein